MSFKMFGCSECHRKNAKLGAKLPSSCCAFYDFVSNLSHFSSFVSDF